MGKINQTEPNNAFSCPALYWRVDVTWDRCAGRVDVKVAKAGDSIEEFPSTNAAAAGNGGVDAGRANVNDASAGGTTAAAASEVTALLSVFGCEAVAVLARKSA